ncbi:MAG TPA: glycosyltransferase [Steroidobacteraceae bacterium]|nr:glycosyltransferase [Steroidobacteraceae bacterium]
MNDAVLVSVVLPVREAPGDDVATALRSVLASELHALEVILVQNGTPNLSPADWASDPRVVTVRLRGSRGTARPLNVGIARARAPYVAFLSPCDLLKPSTLGAAVEALNRQPQAGFVFMDFEHVDAGGNVSRRSVTGDSPALRGLAPAEGGCYLIPQSQLSRALLAENLVALSSLVVRRQLLTEIGPFDESILHCADLDLCFRLGHRCDALYCRQVGHARRHGSAEPGPATSIGAARDRITVLRRESSRWSEPAARRQLRRRIGESYAEMGAEERRQQKRLRSIAMFAAALATFPQGRWLRGLLRSVL